MVVGALRRWPWRVPSPLKSKVEVPSGRSTYEDISTILDEINENIAVEEILTIIDEVNEHTYVIENELLTLELITNSNETLKIVFSKVN